MGRLLAFLLLLAGPAAADMYQDASNAKLPEARANLRTGPDLSPLDYGAKCDGVTDDSAAFTAMAAAAAGKYIALPGGRTCVLANVMLPANSTLDCNGSTLKPPSTAAGKWLIGRTGTHQIFRNCLLDDVDLRLQVSTTLTVPASPGATVLSVASTTNLAVGQMMRLNLDSGAHWVAPITAIGTGTITIRYPVPHSATAVALAAGGSDYNGDVALVSLCPAAICGTGLNVPLVVAATVAAGAVTGGTLKNPGFYDTVPPNPVSFQTSITPQARGGTFNVTWAGAGAGQAVIAAYGLLYSETTTQGLVSNIWTAGGAVAMQTAPGATHVGRDHYDKMALEGATIAGFVKGLSTHDSWFTNITVDCGTGEGRNAVGWFFDDLDPVIYATGGNDLTNVRALGCETGFFMQHAQKDHIEPLSDGMKYTHMICNRCSSLRMPVASFTSGGAANTGYVGGFAIGNSSAQIGIGVLSGTDNAYDINTDGTGGLVMIGMQTGGSAGPGHFITGDGESLYSGVPELSVQTVGNVGGLGTTVYIGKNGSNATEVNATWRNFTYKATSTKMGCYVSAAPGVGNSYTCTLRYELEDTPFSCVIADTASNCIATTPVWVMPQMERRLSIGFTSSASAPAVRGWFILRMQF